MDSQPSSDQLDTPISTSEPHTGTRPRMSTAISVTELDLVDLGKLLDREHGVLGVQTEASRARSARP